MNRTTAFRSCACILFGLAFAVPAAAQCDGITWTYDQPFLTIRHDTEYNCAVFAINHEVAFAGGVLLVREHATASAWADCMCPYGSEVQIGGLPPGAYTLRFEYGENEVDQPPAWWTWCEMPLVIPGAARDEPDVLMVNSSATGCGLVTGVPDEPNLALATWGTIKALYR